MVQTWSVRKTEEDILQRMEMRMMKWIARISMLKKRESADTRRMCGMCNIKEKARKKRLRYFGHVKKRDDVEPVKRERGDIRRMCGVHDIKEKAKKARLR